MFRTRCALVALASLLVVLPARLARADKVDTLIDRLLNSDDYKQRLSAGLNLQKTGDARAIPAFIKALKDSDKTVRGVAAASLGKLIDGGTPEKTRTAAMTALKEVASKDGNAFVQKQAQKAYDAIKGLGGGGAASVAGAKIYVNIGPMADTTKSGDGLVKLMRDTTSETFRKKASGMVTAWPGGKEPTAKDLSKNGTTGYYVDGTLKKLDESKTGSSAVVACEVSMLIASFPGKSMFGFLNGSAKVQSGSSASDVATSKEDCVAAVVEDLVRRKIIPTIETRTP